MSQLQKFTDQEREEEIVRRIDALDQRLEAVENSLRELWLRIDRTVAILKGDIPWSVD